MGKKQPPKPAEKQASVAKARPNAREGKLSKYQKFEPRRMHRRDIHGVAYNPRVIDDYAKARLKKKLETRGLLQALTVNIHPQCMGNLVSGHQRLAILDALEGTDDYELDVDCVKLTPKQEREENAFFNNRSVQGDWDLAKLAELVASDDLDFESMGFTEMDLEVTFEGTDYLQNMFSADEQAPEVAEAMSTLGAMADAGKAERYAGAPVEPDEDAPNGRLENGEAIRDPEAHAAVIEERDRMRAKMKAANEARDPEFYIVVVCKDRATRESLMEHMGKHPDEKYVDGKELAFKLGLGA